MATVLVVDDDPDIRDMLIRALEDEEHTVLAAADGQEALDAQRRQPADVIITDILMPGKEGLQTILELRRNHPDTRVIAISGGGTVGPTDYLTLAENFGADRTFSKPFRIRQLVAAVRDLTS